MNKQMVTDEKNQEYINFVRKHFTADPLFTALVLKDYDTAEKLLDDGKISFVGKVRLEGEDSDGSPKDYEWVVYIHQLFIFDKDLPGRIISKLHQRIMEHDKDESYCVYGYGFDKDVADNILPVILDGEFAKDSQSCSETSCYGERFILLKEKCPAAFEEILLKHIRELSGGPVAAEREYYLSHAQGQNICRGLYEALDLPDEVIKVFGEETHLFMAELSELMEDREMLSRYVSDSEIVYDLIKNSKEAVMTYKQMLLLAMTSVKNLFLFTLSGIEQEANDFYYELMDRIYGILCRIDCGLISIAEYIVSFDTWKKWSYTNMWMTDYADYLFMALELARKYEVEPFVVKETDPAFFNFVDYIIGNKEGDQNSDFVNDDACWGRQREEIYRFTELIDRFCSKKSGTKAGPLYRFLDHILCRADEEMLMVFMQKGLIRAENADEYIEKMLSHGNTDGIPYLIAVSS